MIAEIYKIFKENNYATIGVCIYLFFILVAIFADLIATNDPLRINFSSSGLARNLPPSWEYFLGTTSNGRDIFSQLIYGSRNALAVGLSAALAVAILGTIVGLIFKISFSKFFKYCFI